VSENLQETPIAITVLSGSELEDRQIFNTNVLDQVVPNLQFGDNAALAGNNHSSQVFIRGIGQTDPTSTVDPGVGLYIDDVYMGSAVGGTMTLRDVDSIQVLRGPQGTLFGRNTIGGAILISTKDPGDEYGGTVRAGFGNDNLVDGFLALDTPFSNAVKARFSFGIRQQDGYVTRPDGTDLGDTNTFTGAMKWLFAPSDKFKARLAADYTKADENGSPLVFAAINEAATFPRVASQDAGCPGVVFPASGPVPMLDDPRCANDLQGAGPFHNNGNLPLQSWLENWGTSLNMTFSLNDNTEFKSITAYREIKWKGARDADNTPLTILNTIYDVSGDQFSEELQFTMKTDALLGVVGLYYFEQSSHDIATVDLNPPPPGVQHDSDNNDVDNQSWAAFTQWTFNFTDKFSATLGGRYTEDKKGSYPDQFDYATPNVKQVPVRWYRDTFTSFTPSASLQFLERRGDDLPELLGRLQGRRLEQSLQLGADAGSAGGAAGVRSGRSADHRSRHQARAGGPQSAAELRAVHVRLQGHAVDLSWAGAEWRRTVHHQRRKDRHRWRRSRTHLGSHPRLAHRRQRRVSRCEHRRSEQHPFRGASPGPRGRQRVAVRAGLDRPRRVRLHRARGWPANRAAPRRELPVRNLLRRDQHAGNRAGRRRHHRECVDPAAWRRLEVAFHRRRQQRHR